MFFLAVTPRLILLGFSSNINSNYSGVVKEVSYDLREQVTLVSFARKLLAYFLDKFLQVQRRLVKTWLRGLSAPPPVESLQDDILLTCWLLPASCLLSSPVVGRGCSGAETWHKKANDFNLNLLTG
jgi:hypothetical protein